MARSVQYGLQGLGKTNIAPLIICMLINEVNN